MVSYSENEGSSDLPVGEGPGDPLAGSPGRLVRCTGADLTQV